MDLGSDVVLQLNELSLSEPVVAREEVVRHLRGLQGRERAAFLQTLASAAGSRLRQAVARAVQVAGYSQEMTPILELWLADETDEFARVAISDALAPERRRDRRKLLLRDLDAVPRTFQYLADRMRHRVLNVMPTAGVSVTKLKDIASALGDEQLRLALLSEVDRLSRVVSRVQRAVDFTEDRVRFDIATVDLIAWLNEFVRSYRTQWQEAEIRVTTTLHSAPILAVPYLLETAFENLLDNGRQAVGDGGWIGIAISPIRRAVMIRVADSGEGLSQRAADAAFNMHFSTKGQSGRGLLEVRDALRRLGGDAEVLRESNEIRIVLTVPLAK